MGVFGLEFRQAATGGSRRTRRFLSACLAVLILAAALAPHRHKNDLADLLQDGPSDSGIFIDAAPTPGRGSPPIAESLRWIDDDPCLACLPSDFVTTAAEGSPPSFALLPIGHYLAVSFDADLFVRLRLLASRSPPRV